MGKLSFCKHCQQQFESRRSNHLYCTPSCRTKASYQRNNYRYISGHYEKTTEINSEQLALPVNNELLLAVKELEKKIEMYSQKKTINTNGITEAAIGNAASDATIYAVKKLLAPKTLPATKGDIDRLLYELNELKKSI